MKTTFTKRERFISGIYFGFVAALSLVIVLPHIEFFIAVFLGGFFSGLIVTPAILTPEKFTVLRSIATGCLTTLAAALFSALFLSIFAEMDSLTALSLSDISFYKLKKALTGVLAISVFGALFAIPYSIIGAIAAAIFSYRLALSRNRPPELRPEIFD
ncbi:hypothetical protein [Kiloniella sp.]|uniref:hypothetical protein n=1 Tax=Kiloniella sp. TaxID=1938587 RepID=UPI003B0111AA